MNKRFSKKRQGIIDCIKSTKLHPSAEWIYEQLKPVYPDLSLGTVYRNLNELLASGDIISVGNVEGRERFDGDTNPHAHAVCQGCGKITDILNLALPDETVKNVEKITDYKVLYSGLRFVGICPECAEKKQQSSTV